MAKNNKQLTLLLLAIFTVVASLQIIIIVVNCEDNANDDDSMIKNDDDKSDDKNPAELQKSLEGLDKFVADIKAKVDEFNKNLSGMVTGHLKERCAALESAYADLKKRVSKIYTFDATWGVLVQNRLNLDRFGISQPVLFILDACKGLKDKNELHLEKSDSFWFTR